MIILKNRQLWQFLPYYVPTEIPLEQYLRKVSIADKIANLLVFGFVSSGIFSMLKVILPNFPCAVMLWVFFAVFGSATIFTVVFSLPIPAKLSNAATFMFAGKSETASLALPSKMIVGLSIFSKSIFIVYLYGCTRLHPNFWRIGNKQKIKFAL